jgi:hypothetical protein
VTSQSPASAASSWQATDQSAARAYPALLVAVTDIPHLWNLGPSHGAELPTRSASPCSAGQVTATLTVECLFEKLA